MYWMTLRYRLEARNKSHIHISLHPVDVISTQEKDKEETTAGGFHTIKKTFKSLLLLPSLLELTSFLLHALKQD